ncbi:MAG: carbohydrate ABC transporter permease [Bacilli bacterium]
MAATSASVGANVAAMSSTRRRRKVIQAVIAYLFLLPTFVFVASFSYYPALRALVGAFTMWDGFNPPKWVGFSNFQQLFTDSTFIASVWHVLVWSIVGIPLALIPSFVAAVLIFHLKSLRMQYLYRTLFVLTMILPAIVSILIWQEFYGHSGVLNLLLGAIGLGGLQHDWIANPNTALWAVILMGFPWVIPFNMLIYYSGLQAIPTEIFDAAAVDGAASFKRVLHIEIPMVLAQVRLLFILSVVGVSQNLLTPLLMTGGGPGTSTTTPVLYMYQTAIQYDEYGYGMAIAFLLFIVVMALSVLSMKYFRVEQ